MNLYDISYCWKKAKPTCTYIVVVIFWRMNRPQKYDDHLWCHCMIVMCFDESHWCFAATSMLHDWALLISFACLRPGRFQCGSYWVRTARSRETQWRGSKSNIGKWSPSWTPGQFVFTFVTNVFWIYSNGYYGLQMFAVPKIVQNCDDMGASGLRSFKWARVRPGSKHLRSLLDWCLKICM